MGRVTASLGLIALVLTGTACQDSWPAPKVAPEKSRLAKATDVFWALQNLEFMVVKESPSPTKHGCKPFEYLAQKGSSKDVRSRFRISVFECPTAEKAIEIVENDHTRHVNSLLRNAHEGGVMRRQALEIIIRMEAGMPADADGLLEALGGM